MIFGKNREKIVKNDLRIKQHITLPSNVSLNKKVKKREYVP